jgi:hypothetical protein
MSETRRGVPGTSVLASNADQPEPETAWASVWEGPDALADIAFAAGVLGLFSGLLVVLGHSGTHFPDTLFWRAVPLVLIVPPTLFLGALCAPGGVLEGGWSAWTRAARLGFSGLASYLVPVVVVSFAAAAASVR